MKYINSILLLIVFVLFTVSGYAQCRAFAVSKKKQLEDFVHDGAFTSIAMKPMQNVQFTKTFYKGQKYRLMLDGAAELAKVELRIFDQNQSLIYSNVDDGVSKKWDFMVESTRNMIIMVSVPKNANPNISGCISVLIGFKTTEDLINQYKNK